MAENGPGGREVGRVSLRVLPDTSRFLPSLKKYAERVERTVAVRLSATVDASGAEAEARRITERVERSVPSIRVPAVPVADGFARDLQTKVRAAAASIEANIPLTADGERFRRQVAVEIAELEAEIRRLDIEIPLDVEGAARARAELAARVAALQAQARANPVEVPVSLGSTAGAGGFLGISPATLAGIGAVGAVLTGSAIAALPALIASIAGPVAAIALGFEGIKTAAQVAAPAFAAMRQALSNTFAESLAPVFATLAEVLPQITPELSRIAEALSGAFGTIVEQIASPEGIAALKDILSGIAEAIEILAPSLGPLTQVFLDLAQTGMKAFVDNAPALNDALTTMAGVFTYLNDSGAIAAAAQAFTTFATFAVVAIGAISAVLVALAAGEAKMNEFRQRVADAITGVLGRFGALAPGVGIALSAVVALVRALPARVQSALSGLGDLLRGAGQRLVGGLISGILSMIGPLIQAARTVAGVIADFFPGSPVKEGPLTSWNGGGAGRRLGEMLVSGIDASREAVRSASTGLAGAVVDPSLNGAGVAAVASDGPGSVDPYTLSDVLSDSMRKTHLSVHVRDTDRALAQHRNRRQGM